MKAQHTALHQFSVFMMKHVIPIDTKLTSLYKKRDYKRYILYFNILRKFTKKFTRDNTFIEELDLELMQITIPIYRSYTLILIKSFEIKNADDTLKRLDLLYKTSKDDSSNTRELFLKYRSIIISLEKELTIVQNDFPRFDCVNHVTSSIYDVDHSKMNSVLTLMYEALNYLEIELVKNPDLYGQVDNQQELDYLIMIVHFELWNFISHISHAYTDFFRAPLTYISDIEKGTSHLKRAIMDIYDGLIVDIHHQKITPKYLNIRNKKVRSLGHSKMIFSLSESLRDYYLEIAD